MSERVPSTQPWDIRLLCILFNISENEIPESLRKNGRDIPTLEIVEEAIEKALLERAITQLQLDLLEQYVGRFSAPKTLKDIAKERGTTPSNIAVQKTRVLENLSNSPLLMELISSNFDFNS